MTPQRLKTLVRHLPSSVRRSVGVREADVDPGLVLFQRWPRAGHLRRLLHTAHAVQWRQQRAGLTFIVHLAGGRRSEFPDQPGLPRKDHIGDVEWPGIFKVKARELRTTPYNLHIAIGMLREVARWNTRHDRITFPR